MKPSKTKTSKTPAVAPAPEPIASAPVDMSTATSAPAPSSEGAAAEDSKKPSVTREEAIRHKAYLRYLQRDGAAGSEVDDWLAAEAEHHDGE